MFQGVTLQGLHPKGWDWTFNLDAAVTEDHIYRAVSLKAGTANTVTVLSTGTGEILGQLQNVEDRKVEGIKTGTVKLKGGMKFEAASGHGITVGDKLVAGIGGLVAKAGADDVSNVTAVEINGDFIVALVL